MKKATALGMLVLLVALLTTGIAAAQTPPPVNTNAEVPVGATAPIVRNAFMLPDMNASDNGAVIDLIAPYEDAPGPGPVNVTPYLYNTPQRFMGFWALMESAGGIGSIQDVWVDVFHPDGTHKYQVHMTRVPCESLGLPTTVGTPAAGATLTGQIEGPAWTALPGGILDQCNQGLLAPYFAKGEITKDQPFGVYKYTIGATSLGSGSVVSVARNFEVLQRAGLAIDFGAVNFGQINPLSSKITDGDFVWGNLPSVASVGNVWLNLRVDFDPMVGTVGFPNAQKVIDVFDVVLGAPINTDNPLDQPRVVVDPIPVQADGSTADAVTVPGFILPSNCPTKIQFSIHPEIMGPVRTATGQLGVPSGPYSGVVKLAGVSIPLVQQWTAGWEAALDQCRYDIPAPAAG